MAPRTKDLSLFLTEAVLVGLTIVLLGYIYWNDSKPFDYFPSYVSTYSLKAIYDFTLGLPDLSSDIIFPANGVDSAALTATSMPGFNTVQTMKYTLGCYGSDLLLDPAVFTAYTADQKMTWLTAFQVGAGGYSRLSSCMCIDRMYALSRKKNDGIGANVTANNDKVKTAITEPFYNIIMENVDDMHADHSKYIFTANMVDIAPDDTLFPTVAKQQEFTASMVHTCVKYGMPQYTEEYDGMVSVKNWLIVAQTFVLFGALTMWQFSGLDFLKYNKESYVDKLFEYGTIALQILLTIFGWIFLSEATDKNKEAQLYNDATHTGYRDYEITNGVKTFQYSKEEILQKNYMEPIAWTMLIINLVVLVLQALSIFFIHSDNLKAEAMKQMADPDKDKKKGWEYYLGIFAAYKHGNRASEQVVVRVLVDLPVIVGFTLFAMCILLMSGVNNTTSIATGAILVFFIGVLQHFSNVLKILFTSICQNTGKEVFDSLSRNKDSSLDNQFLPDKTKSGTKQARSVLQFFGYTRLLLFVIILVSTILFLTSARDSVTANTMVNTMNGQLFFFAMAYFWSNVGFDVLAELIPYMHQKFSTDVLRQIFLVGYIAYFNLYIIYHANRLGASSAFGDSAHHPIAVVNQCGKNFQC